MPRREIKLYGLFWDAYLSPPFVEMEMIRRGGQWTNKKGDTVGNGLYFHYKHLQELLWPEKTWHKWNTILLREFIKYRIIGVIGPASSGKTHEAALFALTDYYCYPDQTTVLCSSTEREMLEMRVWGEIKQWHKRAKARFDWLPGELLESRQRIITEEQSAESEGRDFRNGLCGVPCKKGGAYVGLGSYIGIKNKRVRLIADEGQFMPKAYVDAIANLNKNPDFKCIVLGNPKETTDALGMVCEPSAELGGWDGGIDQQGKSKQWPTRFSSGICVQLVGSDSPNMDAPEWATVPFPYLITRKSIESDIAFYGKDSLQFTMMNEGRMPRGQGLKRVITRQMCLKFGAMEDPVWKDEKRTRIGFMDAAYGSVGGDRCVFGEIQFGKNAEGNEILALINTMLVPVSALETELPEDQIAVFVRGQCEQRGIVPQNFFFDSTGRGSLMGAFGRIWSPHVVGVEFGGTASDRAVSFEIRTPCKEYYANRVSELWYSVRLVIACGQFRGMTEEVMQEFCMREWGMVSEKKVKVEPKGDMKLKMGRSPDLADAVASGVEGARQRGFVMQQLTARKVTEHDSQWKRILRERAERLQSSNQLNHAA
jgi:hypothetical protein